MHVLIYTFSFAFEFNEHKKHANNSLHKSRSPLPTMNTACYVGMGQLPEIFALYLIFEKGLYLANQLS